MVQWYCQTEMTRAAMPQAINASPMYRGAVWMKGWIDPGKLLHALEELDDRETEADQ